MVGKVAIALTVLAVVPLFVSVATIPRNGNCDPVAVASSSTPDVSVL
jgi:hypothetical protein